MICTAKGIVDPDGTREDDVEHLHSSLQTCFPQAADGGDASFREEVGGQVGQPLLGDHHVRLEGCDAPAHARDPVLLRLQQRRPA